MIRKIKREMNRRAAALGIAMSLTFGGAALAEPANNALPTGGEVRIGEANIGLNPDNNNQLDIKQTSQNVLIDWATFNVGQQNTVLYNQPNNNSIAVNRVFDTNPSEIAGHIIANGNVTLINPYGINVYDGAQIDVGSFIASTKDLSVEEYKNLFPEAVVDAQGNIVVQKYVYEKEMPTYEYTYDTGEKTTHYYVDNSIYEKREAFVSKDVILLTDTVLDDLDLNNNYKVLGRQIYVGKIQNAEGEYVQVGYISKNDYVDLYKAVHPFKTGIRILIDLITNEDTYNQEVLAKANNIAKTVDALPLKYIATHEEATGIRKFLNELDFLNLFAKTTVTDAPEALDGGEVQYRWVRTQDKEEIAAGLMNETCRRVGNENLVEVFGTTEYDTTKELPVFATKTISAAEYSNLTTAQKNNAKQNGTEWVQVPATEKSTIDKIIKGTAGNGYRKIGGEPTTLTTMAPGAGAVVNAGRIGGLTNDTKLVALVAKDITNTGTITAQNVSMGKALSFNLDGTGRINVAANAETIANCVYNSGNITAQGGTIVMAAKDAQDLASKVVADTGVLSATKIDNVGGDIQLVAEGGEVQVLGYVSAGNDINATATGGNITVRNMLQASHNVNLTGDKVNMSKNATVAASILNVNATASSIEVANDATPYDESASKISATALGNTLGQTQSVTLNSQATTSVGDIRFIDTVTKVAGGETALTLNANRNVQIANNLKSDSGKMNLVFNAGNDPDQGGATLIEGDIATNGGSLATNGKTYIGLSGSEAKANADVERNISTNGGNITLNGDVVLATGKSVHLNAGSGDVEIKGDVNSGNAYYYKSFNGTNNVNWENAKAAAENAGGYLATITGDIENAAVNGTMAGVKQGNALSQGSSAYTAGSATDWKVNGDGTVSRDWYWAAGKENGVLIQTDTRAASVTAGQKDGVKEKGVYTNWSTNEANGEVLSGNTNAQNHIVANYDEVKYSAATPGKWDDNGDGQGAVTGYVVEKELSATSLDINAGNVKVGNIGVEKTVEATTTNGNTVNIVTAAGVNNVTLAATGTIETGNITATGFVDAKKGTGNYKVGNVNAGKYANLVTEGNIIAGNVEAQAQYVNIDGSKGVTVGAVKATTTATLTANNGNVTMGGDLTAGNNVTIVGNDIDAEGHDITSSNGSIYAYKYNNVEADTLKAKNITAGKNVNLKAAAANLSGDIISTGEGNITVEGTINATDAEFMISAGQNGDVDIDDVNAKKLNVIGNNIKAENVYADGYAWLSAAKGNVEVNKVTSTDYVTLSANNGTVTVKGENAVKANSSVAATGKSVNINGNIKSGSTVQLRALDGSVVADGIDADNKVTITAIGNANKEVGDITKGDITLNGAVSAGEGINATATNGDLTAKGALTAKNGNVELTDKSGLINIEGQVTASNDIFVYGKKINVKKSAKVLDAGNRVTIKSSDYDLKVSNDSSVETVSNIDAEVFSNTLGKAKEVELIANEYENNKGNIFISSDVTKTAGGDVDLKLHASRDVEIVADIKSQRGALNIEMTAAGQAYEDWQHKDANGVNKLAATIETNGGTFTANGDVELTGDTVVNTAVLDGNGAKVDINGDIKGNNALTVNASNGAIELQKVNVKNVELSTTAYAETGNITATDNVILNTAKVIFKGNDIIAENGNFELTGEIKADNSLNIVAGGTFKAGVDSLKANGWKVFLTDPGKIESGPNSNNLAQWGTKFEDGYTSALDQYVFQNRPMITVTANDFTKQYATVSAGAGVRYSTNIEDQYTDYFTDGTLKGDDIKAQLLTGDPQLNSDGFARYAAAGDYDIDVDTANLNPTTGYEISGVKGTVTVDDTDYRNSLDNQQQNEKVAVSNAEGRGRIGHGEAALGTGVDRVLGLTEGTLSFGSVSRNGVRAVSYDVNVTPDKVNVSKSEKQGKRAVVGKANQYRSLQQRMTVNGQEADFNLAYNGAVLDVYPTDDVSKAMLQAGDANDNADIVAKALHTSFNKMGVELEDLDGVNVHIDATEAESK